MQQMCMIIDQEDFRRKLLEKSIQKVGWKPFTLASTEEFLFYIKDLQPQIVIFDLATFQKDPLWEQLYHEMKTTRIVLGEKESVQHFIKSHPVELQLIYPLSVENLLSYLKGITQNQVL